MVNNGEQDTKHNVRVKNWLQILVVPLTIAVVGGCFTYITNERQRITAEWEAKAQLTRQYTEIFLREYKNVGDPKVKPILTATAGIMKQLELTGAEEFLRLVDADRAISSEHLEVMKGREPGYEERGYEEKKSYTGNCLNLPKGQVCLRFSDGYVWLITDSVIGWRDFEEGNEKIEVAIGINAYYFHVLDTKWIKEVEPLE